MSKAINKLTSNIWKLYLGNFLTELLFFVPILVPFLQGLGFSMQEILLMEAGFAATLIILEIPSGYFADIFGRKKSIVIGAFFDFLGIAVYALANTFWGFLFGQVLLGIGTSFISGAAEALLYETLVQTKQEKNYKKVQGNLFFAGRIASLISNGLGGVLAMYYLRFPIYISVIPVLLSVPLSFTLIETKTHKKKHETWNHFIGICKESFISNKILRYFLIFSAISGFFIIGFWLHEKYMIFIDLPIIYFGFVIAAMNLVSGLAGKYAQEIEKFITPKLSLISIFFIPFLGWLALAFLKTIWAIPLLLISSILWGFTMPVFADFLQKIVSNDRRATVMSIMSFLRRLVFLIFAPFLGWITDLYSIQEAFLAISLLILIFGTIGAISLKKVKIL